MTGGGPAAEQGFGTRRPSKSKPMAACCSQPLNRCLFLMLMSDNCQHPPCHCLETVRQFQPKTAPVLLDKVHGVKTGGGIRVPAVQEVVNARRELEVLDELLAEERQVDDA